MQSNYGGPFRLSATQGFGEDSVEIAYQIVQGEGSYVLDFTPTTGNVHLNLIRVMSINDGSLAGITLLSPWRWTLSYTNQNQLVQICPLVKDEYRFGFNGQHKDNEYAGIGNHLEFKFRGYDSRLGRFLVYRSFDAKFPWWSPYQFAGNSPIAAIDLEGAESKVNVFENVANKDGTSAIHVRGQYDIVPAGPLGNGILNVTYQNDSKGSLKSTSWLYGDKKVTYSSFNKTEQHVPFDFWKNSNSDPAWRKSEAWGTGEKSWENVGKPRLKLAANSMAMLIGVGELAAGAKGLALLFSIADVTLTADDMTADINKLGGGDGTTVFQAPLSENGRKGLSAAKAFIGLRSVWNGVKDISKGVKSAEAVEKADIGKGIFGVAKGGTDAVDNYSEAIKK